MAAAEIRILAARRFFIAETLPRSIARCNNFDAGNPKNSVTLGESAHYRGSGNHWGEYWDVRGANRCCVARLAIYRFNSLAVLFRSVPISVISVDQWCDFCLSSVFLRVLSGKGFGFPDPTRLFRHFCCKQRHFRRSILAWRLGGPCVALGWPLGGPRVAQASPKPNPNQAEGRNASPSPKYQEPSTSFSANCQLLIANCFFSKSFLPQHTLRRCQTIAIFFSHINGEVVHRIHGPDKCPPSLGEVPVSSLCTVAIPRTCTGTD